MSLLDLFGKLFRNPVDGLSFLMEAPMSMEIAIGWLIFVGAGVLTLAFFVWFLMKITGR